MHYCYVLVNLGAITCYCYELGGCAQRIRCVLCMIEMLNSVYQKKKEMLNSELHFGCCRGIMMIYIENNKSNDNLAKTIKNKNFHRLEVVRWNQCIIKFCDVEDFCKWFCSNFDILVCSTTALTSCPKNDGLKFCNEELDWFFLNICCCGPLILFGYIFVLQLRCPAMLSVAPIGFSFSTPGGSKVWAHELIIINDLIMSGSRL